MTSAGSSNKKKKRKAAKKKKKNKSYNKFTNNNKGINVHSPTTNFQGENERGCVTFTSDDRKQNGQTQEESCSTSTVGLVLESSLMEGSGNDGDEKSLKKPESGMEEERVVRENESEGDSVSRAVSIEYVDEGSTSLEEPRMVQKNESLVDEKAVLLKEEDKDSFVEAVRPVEVEEAGSSTTEVVSSHPIDKAVLISEEMIQVLEDNPAVKTGDSSVTGLLPEKNEDKLVLSRDAIVETSDEPEESDSIEVPQNQELENVPFIQPLVQRTTWKSCCGLFDVLSGSNR